MSRSRSQRKKVCIKYGIGEGDYHGRTFVAALKEAGFEIIRGGLEADIVVTHSGGCFFLPPPGRDQVFIIINPPYWPGKSLGRRTLQKVLRDFMDYARDGKLLQWSWKTTMNIAHILRYLIKALTMTLHTRKQRFYEALNESGTTIVRTDGDTFLTPDANELLRRQAGRKFTFIRLPGQHDSCWRDPSPYVEIIKKAAGR